MKVLNKILIYTGMIAMTITVSCKKTLEEHPTSSIYPAFLGTKAGIFGAITGVYSSYRSGQLIAETLQWYYCGTDEMYAGVNLPNMAWATYNGLNSGVTASYGMFNAPYQYINTLNGAIQFSQTVDIDAASKTLYVAEAKFLRAYFYFNLVQTFGNIPLHTTFSTTATTADSPAPIASVYNQIIQDFTDAAAGLPNTITSSNPFSGGGQGKTPTAATAMAFLAKVYLTRGYSSAAQSTDFQQAATITSNLITNQGTYKLGLWPDYNQTMDQANDYGQEVLFAIDMGNDPTYGALHGINNEQFEFRWNYVSSSGVNSNASVPIKVSGANVMVRDIYNGRPFSIEWPTSYTLQTAFADKVNDCRYDATFQTYWINNVSVKPGLQTDGVTPKGQLVPTTVNSMTSWAPPINGDTAILMPNTEVTVARRDAFKGMIVTPAQYNNAIFPTVKKFDDRINQIAVSDASSRPFILMRFSEVYLMNAEANYMLNNFSAAAASLNIIRQRAAYRTPADATYIDASHTRVTAASMAVDNAAHIAAMALTSTQLAQLAIPNNTTVGSGPCGMDLILDEYTREYYGDPRRWYDLARTGQLLRRVKLWNSVAAQFIQPYMALRPIPQNEIDAVLTGPKYPQNPGY